MAGLPDGLSALFRLDGLVFSDANKENRPPES